MNFKEETKKLLELLSEQGFTQVKIARLLGYGERSISQIQNKGGTESLYNAIFLFSDYVRLKKSNNEQIDTIGQDSKSGAQDVNSGSPDHDPGTFLELISKKQKELADEIDVFLKAYSEHSSKSGSQTTDYILHHFKKLPYRFVATATPTPNVRV